MLLPEAPPVDNIQLRPVLEIRERVERRLDRDFSAAGDDDRSDLFSRLRVGFDFTLSPGVSGRLRYQYGHNWIWSTNRNFSVDNSDLYLAHLDFRAGNGTISVGRQLINHGDKRLLEEANWGQRSVSYDLLRYRQGNWEIYGGRVGYSAFPGDTAAVAGTAYLGRNNETFLFYKHDRNVANQSFATLSHRLTRRLGATDLAVEAAVQGGRVEERDHSAFWLHGRASTPVAPQTRLWIEGNVASGGTGPRHNKGFIPLYGTTHNFYGLTDMQGLRNMIHLEVGLAWRPGPLSEYTLRVNNFALYDPSDAWYGTRGRPNSRPGGAFVDPTGQSGRDVGREVAITGRWQLSPRETLEAQAAVFLPGSFIRSVAGPSVRNQYWFALMYTFRY
jgi:hypothetical protein